MRTTASLMALIFGLSVESSSQTVPPTSLDLDGWELTGASALSPRESAWTLPAGAQLSRVFGQGQSVTARLSFEAILSVEPEDVVSLQIGRSTLAFTRSIDRGLVFAAERDGLAAEPLLTVELAPVDDARVAVGLAAFVGGTDPKVRVEIAGQSVEWPISRSDGDALEFAVSAGRSAPVRISEFEFLVDRPASNLAGKREGTDSGAARSIPSAASQANLGSSSEPASAPETNAPSGPQANVAAEAHTTEPRSGAPPGGGGLEVFTPPSVRRHGPDANANERAKEVAP